MSGVSSASRIRTASDGPAAAPDTLVAGRPAVRPARPDAGHRRLLAAISCPRRWIRRCRSRPTNRRPPPTMPGPRPGTLRRQVRRRAAGATSSSSRPPPMTAAATGTPGSNAKKADRQFDDVMAPNYVGPFVSVGRVFAPRYRQASLYSLTTLREDAREARQFAYGDVRQAFRWYVANDNGGRPFVLVGVEQGGTLGLRLLAEEIAPNPELRRRLVVAYLQDTVAPADRPPIPPCAIRGADRVPGQLGARLRGRIRRRPSLAGPRPGLERRRAAREPQPAAGAVLQPHPRRRDRPSGARASAPRRGERDRPGMGRQAGLHGAAGVRPLRGRRAARHAGRSPVRCNPAATGPTGGRSPASICSTPTSRPTRSTGWRPGSRGDKVSRKEDREDVMNNRQIVLDRLPGGERLSPEHFALSDGERPTPARGRCCSRPATSPSTPPTAPGCRAPPIARH